jgi:predicted nucleic-acid-binding protein
VPVITEDQYTLLTYIGDEGKTVEECCDYQPLGLFWDSKTFIKVLGELQWSNLVNEENRFITLNKFGEAAIKKYKNKKRLDDLERFPKVYWPIMNIIAWLLGIATAILIDKCKLSNQVQTKTAQTEQSLNKQGKLSDSTLKK